MIFDAIKPYAKLLEVVAIAIAALWAFHAIRQGGYDSAMAEVAKRDDISAKAHQIELDKAGHAHDAELADLARYVSDHPVSVRLCPVGPVQVTPAPGAGSGTATGNIQPVSAGNPAERTGERPDIGPLLNLLAVRADETSADLREQQSVK